MSIIATNRAAEKAPIVDEGAYPARVYSLIHIGTIEGFQGMMQNKVRIGFELPTELYVFDESKGEQPRVISKEYTLSFNEKANLRKVIEACDPKGLKIDGDGFLEEYDVLNLIGKECLITVKHEQSRTNDNLFAVIDNCTVIPKGMNCPPAVNPVQVLSYDTWDETLFEKLPEFLKDKITSSEEYKKMKGITEEILIDGIPF